MSDEYLIEKRGGNVEIERLEELLSVYRIEPVAPSIGRAHLGHAKSGRVRFRLVHAFSVGLAFAAAAFVFAIGYFELRQNEVTVIGPADAIVTAIAANGPEAPVEIINSRPTPDSVGLNTKKVRRIRPVRIRASHVPKRSSQKTTLDQLTAEERHAYQQVLVALWITSSKLKVVQDTINRVYDDKESFVNDKR